MLTKLKFNSGSKKELVSTKAVRTILQNTRFMKSLKKHLKNMCIFHFESMKNLEFFVKYLN